jgi:hypothetical protein
MPILARKMLSRTVLGTGLASAAAYDTKFYNQTLDHFNPQDGRRWSHR